MTATSILARYKEDLRKKFRRLSRRAPQLPEDFVLPTDPKKALLLGIQMGRKEGYGEGLLDGTHLGLEVGLETVDEVLSQPGVVVSPSIGFA